jgi:predicted RNase H-like HicB family nuclease
LETNTRTYTLVLLPDTHEGGYSVVVPALPGCFTQGDTLEQAVENAREAITLHILCLAADGEPIPDETEHPQLLAIEVTAPERDVA